MGENTTTNVPNNVADGDATNSTPVEESQGDDVAEEEEPSESPSWPRRVLQFYWKHKFILLVAFGILMAKAYPKLGAVYLQPEITASWIAVCLIFFLVGLCLRTEEFKNAIFNVYFNVFVQVFSFFVVSGLVFESVEPWWRQRH